MGQEGAGASREAERGQVQESLADEEEAISALTLAQVGNVDKAAAVLSNLRSKHTLGGHPRVMIRVLLLEAGIYYYKDRSSQSLDRSRRALALSRASKFDDLEAEAAVWNSLFCFNFDKYTWFGDSLKVAFRSFFSLRDSLRARLCLLVADAYQFFGENRLADQWYRNSRIFARRAQERPILVAIEYNRIVMALSRLRLDRFIDGDIRLIKRKDWVEEIKSVERLHQGLQIGSLAELLLLSEAMAWQSAGHYLKSVAPLEEIQARNASHLCGLSERQLELEIEWCRVLSGQISSLDELSLPTLEQVVEWSQSEQIVSLKQLEEIYSALGVKFNQVLLSNSHVSAVQQCLLVDNDLRAAVEICQSQLGSVEMIALARPSA